MIKKLDYYSPVIIANNDYLKNNKEEAQKVLRAIKKGYVYAIEHPEEAAEILIKNAPELKIKKISFLNLKNIYLNNMHQTKITGVNSMLTDGMHSTVGLTKIKSQNNLLQKTLDSAMTI